MVAGVRKTELALGDGRKHVTKARPKTSLSPAKASLQSGTSKG